MKINKTLSEVLYIIGILVLTASLARCATPYQPMGYRGGYRDEQIGKNRYLIYVQGNGYTGSGTIQSYAFRRAREVCKENGHSSFELINKSNASSNERSPSSFHCTTYGNSTNCQEQQPNSWTKHSAEISVSCTNE